MRSGTKRTAVGDNTASSNASLTAASSRQLSEQQNGKRTQHHQQQGLKRLMQVKKTTFGTSVRGLQRPSRRVSVDLRNREASRPPPSSSSSSSSSRQERAVGSKGMKKALARKKPLTREERESRAKFRKKRQLAERMAQLRDTRMEVEQLSRTAGSSPNAYSVAFKRANYHTALPPAVASAGKETMKKKEEMKKERSTYHQAHSSSPSSPSSSNSPTRERTPSVGFGSPRHIYDVTFQKESSSTSTFASPSSFTPSSSLPRRMLSRPMNSPTLMRLQRQESKLEEEIRKINATLTTLSTKKYNTMVPTITTSSPSSISAESKTIAPRAAVIQNDTPRGRRRQLKQTREVESLKRGLDWEIQQFEMSLKEFSDVSQNNESKDSCRSSDQTFLPFAAKA